MTPEQATLDFSLLSHSDDPETSRKAAAIAQGRAKGHAATVYRMLYATIPSTATGIARLLANNPDFTRDAHARLCQVRKRLSDLRRLGLAIREGSSSGESLWFMGKR